MHTFVSILIPTYNRADYLREAIQSALAQTHPNIEVVVLDDASPDHTADVVAEFAADPRLRYIRHPQNQGIAGNWRAGIEAITGDFFCLLHDDDTFAPTFVEALLEPLIQDNSLILAFCDQWFIDASGDRLQEETDSYARRFKRDTLVAGRIADFGCVALVDASVPVGATLFRKTMVPSSFIADQAKGAIDAWLFYQCVKTGYGAFYVPERLMNYRSHSGGMSVGMPLYMAEGHLFRYGAMLTDPEFASLYPAIQQMRAETLTCCGIDLLAQGDTENARRKLWEAMRTRISLRDIVALALSCGGQAGVRATVRLRE